MSKLHISTGKITRMVALSVFITLYVFNSVNNDEDFWDKMVFKLMSDMAR